MSEQQDEKPKLLSRAGLKKHQNKIIIGLLVAGAASMFVMGGSNDEANNNVQVKTGEMDTGSVIHATNPEQIKSAEKYDELRAQAASQAGTSHIDRLKPQMASNTSDPFNPVVAAPAASAPAATSLGTNPHDINTPANAQNQNVQPMVTEKIVEKTIVKEVPVAVQAEYDWRKDASLINYFANGKPMNGGAPQASGGGGGGNSSGYSAGGMGASSGGGGIAYNQAYLNKKATANANGGGGVGGNFSGGFGAQTPNLGNTKVNLATVSTDTSRNGGMNGAGNANGGANANGEVQQQTPVVLVRSGDLPVGALMTPIASSQPSIVRARIYTGALKGATLTGTFQNNGTSIAVTFNSMTLPNVPRSIPINAVALDLDSASTALASSVDRHIPERFLGTLVTQFAERYADIMRDNNTASNTRLVINEQTGEATQITTNSTEKKTSRQIVKEAGADAISEATQSLVNLIPQEPTVKVKGNIPIGIYFMQDLQVDSTIAEAINFVPVYK